LCADYDSPEYNEEFLKLKTSKNVKWEINFMVLDCDNTKRICDENVTPFGKRSYLRWYLNFMAMKVNPSVNVDEQNNLNVTFSEETFVARTYEYYQYLLGAKRLTISENPNRFNIFMTIDSIFN